MEVDQKVAVRTVLILADPRLGQRSTLQQREAAVAEGDDLRQRGLARPPVLGVGVDLDPVGVVGELDAAALEVGEAVEDVPAGRLHDEGPAASAGAGRGRQEA